MMQSRPKLKKFLISSILLLSVFGLIRVYNSLTDDFRIGNIQEDLPYRAEWETSALSEKEQKELSKILDQRFTYLAKGAQSYAFASTDGKYVLKFFKFKHARPQFWVQMIPPFSYLKDYKKRHYGKKRRKMIGPFRGYCIANDKLRGECGLVAVHLNKTKNLNQKVKVKDKIGFVRTIDLDDVVFAVQERAEMTPVVLARHLDAGDVKGAKIKLWRLEEMLRNEYRNKIGDHDRYIFKNSGFIGDRPIRIDVGMLYLDPGMEDPEYELEGFRNELKNWVEKNYPQYAEDLL